MQPEVHNIFETIYEFDIVKYMCKHFRKYNLLNEPKVIYALNNIRKDKLIMKYVAYKPLHYKRRKHTNFYYKLLHKNINYERFMFDIFMNVCDNTKRRIKIFVNKFREKYDVATEANIISNNITKFITKRAANLMLYYNYVVNDKNINDHIEEINILSQFM